MPKSLSNFDVADEKFVSSNDNKPDILENDYQTMSQRAGDQLAIDQDVFTQGEGDVDFRGVSWFGAAIMIAKSQIGLGVLGIPFTFATLGFVPGMITLVFLSVVSFWTGLIVGAFRNAHPGVYSISDASYILFGKVGRECMGVAFWLLYTFCAGSAALGVSQAFNTLSEHSMCTVAFTAIAAAISLVIGLFTRTLKWMSWVSYVALTSVFLAAWIVAIACLAQDHPADAPAGTTSRGILIVGNSSFGDAMAAISTQLFSLGGTASFFTIHAEMREPHLFRRSLILGQSFVILNYVVVGAIMYGRVGAYVTSPALGSAGLLFKKISFGIALPALFFSCFFQAHLAAKYAFVRILRGTVHLQKSTFTHRAVWFGSMLVSIVIAFVVACFIPFFGDLLGLIGAFLLPAFVIIVPACLWLHLTTERILAEEGDVAFDKGDGKLGPNRLSWVATSWSVIRRKGGFTFVVALAAWFVIFAGLFIFITGTYGSIASIVAASATDSFGSSFSCADNS